jgi:hypothetical protein
MDKERQRREGERKKERNVTGYFKPPPANSSITKYKLNVGERQDVQDGLDSNK